MVQEVKWPPLAPRLRKHRASGREGSTKPLVLAPGDVFWQLTVIRQVESLPGRGARYECMCTCGKTVLVQGYHLKAGNNKSCGCRAPGKPKKE